MLTKLFLNNKSREYAHHTFSNYNKNNKLVCIDCFNRIYDYDKLYIPQLFNNNYIFISMNSFQQNHYKLRNEIRKYVLTLINENNISCIGGESYIYGLLKCQNINHYTNSEYIYNDCHFNNKFYKKNINNNLINYNKNIFIELTDICIINISNLTNNIINAVTKFNKIIIISCHHDNFWKKRKILNNFTLNRKYFICNKLNYFITVNIFIKKNSFISLGSNCSIAYHLNNLKLRTIAYPFDWCNINYNQLVLVLENNFLGYDDIVIKKFSENHFLLNINNKNSYILKNDYNITFAHEVENNTNYDINNFKSKLLRRIERFKKLNNIIFIRIEKDNITNYDKLINILDKYFTNYKIILISNNNINHHKIINYKLPKFINWKYNNFHFHNII